VPVLLALIPPFVSQAGALGGIFTSRTASKLQIGVITPRGLPEIPAPGRRLDRVRAVDRRLHDGGDRGVRARGGDRPRGDALVPALVAGTILSGLIVTPVTLVAGYYLAVGTFRFGLDPDDQGVPIITSVMDLAGVAVVLFVMTSLGVLPNG
jgi:Permease, similar to cation transporters